MARCVSCNSSVVNIDSSAGGSYCGGCGIVLEENTIVSEITFGETSGGAAMVQGSYVSADATRAHTSGPYGNRGPQESKEQAIANGKKRIKQLAQGLKLSERLSDAAQRWFNLAVSTSFIKGRRSGYVIAACLYITCRMEKTSHMLIDFSDMLQVNVFVLGSTYLKLVKTLNITIPIMDPSLYISRFAALLEFKEETQKVATDAVRLVQRFNRDWMATGRRPAGICGACLLLAARMNNFRRSVQEIVQVVKIADTTLKKRLDEFKATASGNLSIQDFRTTWETTEENPPAFIKNNAPPKPVKGANKAKRKRSKSSWSNVDELADEPGTSGTRPSSSSPQPGGTPSARDKGKGRELSRAQTEDAPGSPSVAPSSPRGGTNEADAVFQAAADFNEDDPNEKGDADDDNDKGDEDQHDKGDANEEEDFTAQLRAIDGRGPASSQAGPSSPAQAPESSQLPMVSMSQLSQPLPPLKERSPGTAGSSSRPKSSKQPTDGAEPAEADPDDDFLDEVLTGAVAQHLDSGQGAELQGELNDADRRAAERRAQADAENELEGLDEDELDAFIMTPQEVTIKTRLWMEFNKDYLQKLAMKQAKAMGEPGSDGPKKGKRKRKDGPPQSVRGATPAESARNLAAAKKFSKKINYKAFDTLFDNSTDIPQRMQSRESTIAQEDHQDANEKEDGDTEKHDAEEDAMHDSDDDFDAQPAAKKGRTADGVDDDDFAAFSSSFRRGGNDDDEGFEEV